ncbi:MAG: hypothetical protein WCD86_26135, partial [Ktedonobacteraceae bacterium]
GRAALAGHIADRCQQGRVQQRHAEKARFLVGSIPYRSSHRESGWRARGYARLPRKTERREPRPLWPSC